MACDQQLLDTARDYFNFVARFFEVINLSAPHIYHSALELSPHSSIIRKHYHHYLKPRVVYGLPNSWDQPAAVIGNYGSYTWSPSGQSFSALASASVEIWDAVTLAKLSTLHISNPDPKLQDPGSMHDQLDLLSYSPDGHSLTSCFGSAITIWDIQTGGVIEEIEAEATSSLPQTLMWSLDGKAIGTVFPAEEGTWVVCVYNVALGTKVSTGTFLSSYKPCLWPHNNSLRIMTMHSDVGFKVINIFEIWPEFVNRLVESFSINLDVCGTLIRLISFSPTTYRISVITGKYPHPCAIFAFDVQKSEVLLQRCGPFNAAHFSPDGNLLIASGQFGDTYIWRYASDQGYALWRKFPRWGYIENSPRGYQFSPTSSSILLSSSMSLEVRQLEDLATGPPMDAYYHYTEFSADGTYLVTATEKGQVITITNLHKGSTEFVDIKFGLCALILTGNILLVQGEDILVAWRLTAEGTVNGATGVRRVDYSHSLWSKPLQERCTVQFWVDGHTGVVKHAETLICYNTETGEELDPASIKSPLPSSFSWKDPNSQYHGFKDWSSFTCHEFTNCDDPSKEHLVDSDPWYKEGWVKCPEGEYQHWFWLPVTWRPSWEEAHWIQKVRTLRLNTASGLVVIRF